MYYCSIYIYIRSSGSADESRLAADKSIWDECWSPGAAWRSPSPHLGSVIERSPRSRLRRPVGRLQGKSVGRLRHAQMSRIKGAAGRRFTLEKPSQAARGQRRRKDGEVEGWKRGCINGPLYCFVLLKLRAQIS